ncbi:MAG: division/cell wall cluster transcriptional repressor MraZ [Salibacteraceae bacterium]
MAGLLGEYECKLDSKSRFLLPAGLRKQIDPSAREEFVMNRGFEGCLVLYPGNEWEKITSRLQGLNLFIAKNRAFYRQFHNGATAVGLDGNGRMLVPKALMKFAGIDKEVVLFAYADRIEIWSKEKYEEVMNQDADSFATLAEEVMGGLNDKDAE